MKEDTHGIFRRCAGFLVLLLAALLYVIQIPEVQTRIAGKLISRFSSQMDAKVSVSSINIMGINAFLIKDILILDDNPLVSRDGLHRMDNPADSLMDWESCDTLFYASSISATFSLRGVLSGEGLHLGRVNVRDAVMNLVIEPDTFFSNNLSRMFGIGKSDKGKKAGGSIFDIRKLDARNLRYTMRSTRDAINMGSGIDYCDLDVTAHRLRGHGLSFRDGRMYAYCDELNATEKCGYTIQSLTGRCAVGQGLTEVWDIHLIDRWTDLEVDEYTMRYSGAHSFSDYIHSVRMGLHNARGRLGIPTITMYSGGALQGNNLSLNILQGEAEGYVDDIKVSTLRFEEIRSDGSIGLRGNLRGRLTGIPAVREMAFDTHLEEASLETADIATWVKSWAGMDLPEGIAEIAPGERISAEASLKGLLDRGNLHISLGSDNLGNVTADAKVDNLLAGKGMSVKAKVNGNKLSLNKIISNIPLVSVDVSAEGRVEMLKDGLSIDIDRLELPYVSTGQYELRDLSAHGAYSPDGFVLKLASLDPEARLNISAEGKLGSGRSASYRLDAGIDRLKFRTSAAPDSSGIVHLAATIAASLEMNDRGTTSGSVSVNDILLTGYKDSLNIRPLEASLLAKDGRASISLDSDYLKANYEGASDVVKAFADLKRITIDEQLPVLAEKKAAAKGSIDTYDISLSLHKPYEIVSILKPELYVSDSTSVYLKVDQQGRLDGKITSPRLAYGGNYLKGVDIDLDNYGCLNAAIKGKELRVGAIVMNEPALTSFIRDDEFNVQLHYDNMSGIGGYGELYVDGELYRERNGQLVLKANPLDSYISVDRDVWEFNESEILVRGSDIDIDNFVVTNGDQRLMVDGGFSKSRSDTLDIYLDDLDLSIIDRFSIKKIGIEGLATGHACLVSPTAENMGFMLKLGCESVSIGGHSMGDVNLAGRWEDADRQFRAYLSTYNDDRPTLAASASWDVERRRLDANINMDRFELGFIQPVVPELFREISGSLSGDIALSGSRDGGKLSSNNTRINNVRLTPALTGSTYILDGPFEVNDSGLQLDRLPVRDISGGVGSLSGTLAYDSIYGAMLDARADFSNLSVIDSQDASRGFYGDLRVSGDARLKGPLQALDIDADLRTSGDGNVNVSLASSLVGVTSDLLTFAEPVKELDHYELTRQLNAQGKKKSSSNISVRARLNVSPEVTAVAEIDKTNGTMASVYGNGNVDLEIRPSKNIFNINGEYIVSGGSAKVAVAGLVDKVFSIKEGGSVKFGGDILQSELDMTAVYSLKTSLATILADTTAVASRRPVDCSINVSDKILNPNITFGIDIPDLDPTTRSQVESALNTDDKVKRQFVSLLIFGTFMPDEISGIQRNSNILLSNVGEVMAGQISSILQKLDIPLDLGFGYQMSNGEGNDIFDVALSTQLFNNRVIINGSFGNRQYKVSEGTSDVVGDVDVAIKVNKQGNVRVNLFSHSADDYTSYLDYSQRSGAGISFQREFNRWADIFKGLFRKNRDEETPDTDAGHEQVTIKVE